MLIDVAFCVDAANLKQVAVVMASIRRSALPTTGHRFHLIYDGAEGEDLKAFRNLTRGQDTFVHFASSRFDKHAQVGHISSAALLRTQLPVVLPDVHRALYLDADLIVQRDLTDLFNTDLDGCVMAGVVDIGMYALINRLMANNDPAMFNHMANTVGLDPHETLYVNSGMLLLDLDALRAMSFSQLASEVLDRRGNEFIWRDQDLINHLLAGKVKQLDPRWNVLASLMLDVDDHSHVPASLKAGLAAQEREQWIVHYTAWAKPWNSENVWRRELWWEIARSLDTKWPAVGTGTRRGPLLRAIAKVYRTLLPHALRTKLLPLKIALHHQMKAWRRISPIAGLGPQIGQSKPSKTHRWRGPL